jgi:hypothetical protein
VKDILRCVDKIIYICDAFQKDCIWPDAEKHVNFSSCASVCNRLVICGIFSTYELCDGHVHGDKSSEEKEKDNHNLEQVMSFIKKNFYLYNS